MSPVHLTTWAITTNIALLSFIIIIIIACQGEGSYTATRSIINNNKPNKEQKLFSTAHLLIAELYTFLTAAL